MTATRGRPLFQSFLQGGFEASSHRRRDGRQLDVLAATRHDLAAEQDYRLLRQAGLHTVRDGLRWHLIETSPGRYDWSSFLPMLRAARQAITACRTTSTSGRRPSWIASPPSPGRRRGWCARKGARARSGVR